MLEIGRTALTLRFLFLKKGQRQLGAAEALVLAEEATKRCKVQRYCSTVASDVHVEGYQAG